MIFIKFRKFLVTVSSDIPFVPLSLSFSSETPIMQMSLHLVIFHRSLNLCSFSSFFFKKIFPQLGYLSLPIFRFMVLSTASANQLLNCRFEFLTPVIILSKSRISIWFLLRTHFYFYINILFGEAWLSCFNSLLVCRPAFLFFFDHIYITW